MLRRTQCHPTDVHVEFRKESLMIKRLVVAIGRGCAAAALVAFAASAASAIPASGPPAEKTMVPHPTPTARPTPAPSPTPAAAIAYTVVLDGRGVGTFATAQGLPPLGQSANAPGVVVLKESFSYDDTALQTWRRDSQARIPHDVKIAIVRAAGGSVVATYACVNGSLNEIAPTSLQALTGGLASVTLQCGALTEQAAQKK
jgi:hypothetical protein